MLLSLIFFDLDLIDFFVCFENLGFVWFFESVSVELGFWSVKWGTLWGEVLFG